MTFAPALTRCLLACVIGVLAWSDTERLSSLLCLLLLPLVVFKSATRSSAFLVAFCYYAVGAHAVPGIITGFFPHVSMGVGLLIWGADAALLALPWALAFAGAKAAQHRRILGVLGALLVLSIPPIGLLHWGSPLMVAGLLFPAWQWAGLGITAVLLALIAVATRCTHRVHAGIALAGVLALGANLAYEVPQAPANWQAISMETGKNPALWSDAMLAKRQSMANVALLGIQRGTKVIIFPEASSGSSKRAQTDVWAEVAAQGRLRGATVLLGEEHWSANSRQFKNALIGFGAERSSGAVVVSSLVPMPMGDWKFGLDDGAELNIFGSNILVLHGVRVAFSMCYEDFLLWPHRALLNGGATVMVSSTNQWPSKGTSAEVIQDISRAALARMAGVALLTAKNR